MIKLNISSEPNEIVPNYEYHENAVNNSLKEIANLVPDHKSENFKNNLWKLYKNSIWEEQGRKCAFCEKEILCSDDAHIEHFRPKTETCDENNKTITRKSYWWLAYEYKNFLVACSTCNKLKGNKFPIENEKNRVEVSNFSGIISLTVEGNLGKEVSCTINPRYVNPEEYLSYNYQPDTRVVYVVAKNNCTIGIKTIGVLDLNRVRKNEDVKKDFLPSKRGDILSEFKSEIENYTILKNKLDEQRNTLSSKPELVQLVELVNQTAETIKEKRDNIKERFLAKRAQFSGMCLFWLKNDTKYAKEFFE